MWMYILVNYRFTKTTFKHERILYGYAQILTNEYHRLNLQPFRALIVGVSHMNHYVSGFFVHQEEAGGVYEKLIAGGIPTERVRLYTNQLDLPEHKLSESSNEVLKYVLVDGTIGIAGLGS